MRRTIRQIALLAALFVLTGFTVVLVNQTAQLVGLAARVNPFLGDAVLWALVALYAFCLLVPLYLIFSLPRALKPPASEADPDFPAHLERLAKRLRSNRHLAGKTVASRAEIEAAILDLDTIADRRTQETASQVFVTTAISQNGSLDTFLVLAAQTKLVLEIARTYYQRPTLRDLTYLYANVAGTAFVAGELEDLDLSEQVQPIIASAFGSAAGAIPGFGAASTLFVNSVATGATNAFLTLRVGAITKQYCRALVLPPRRAIRRLALAEATRMLGAIVMSGTRRVATAIGAATRSSVTGAIGNVGDQMRTTATGLRDRGASAWTRVNRWARGDEPGGEGAD